MRIAKKNCYCCCTLWKYLVLFISRNSYFKKKICGTHRRLGVRVSSALCSDFSSGSTQNSHCHYNYYNDRRQCEISYRIRITIGVGSSDETLLPTVSRRQTNQLAKANKRKIHNSTFLPNCSGYSSGISLLEKTAFFYWFVCPEHSKQLIPWRKTLFPS